MNELHEGKLEALTNCMISQAKYFLDDIGEFYPFGAVLDKNQNIKPVSVLSEEEYPNSIEVLKQLEQRIRPGIRNNDYLLAGIGIDVYINVTVHNTIEKKSALELRLSLIPQCTFCTTRKVTNIS